MNVKAELQRFTENSANLRFKLFPNLKVIMLMGDVAKKAFNIISKKESGKNAVPSISTYKLRNTKIFYKGILHYTFLHYDGPEHFD